MFVGVARLTLQIPDSGSLKAKRQILHRVIDRVKARFNAAIAEVADNDLWQRATLGLAVVGNERKHVDEQLEKIIHFVDQMYVAPLLFRETEILAMGSGSPSPPGEGGLNASGLPFAREDRSLAEAEGLGTWEERHEPQSSPKLSLDDARAKARRLRNPREWERKK